MHAVRLAATWAVIISAALAARPARAFFHLWRFTEFFSSASGDVQFIELHATASGENFASGATIRSTSTGKVFTFPSDLAGSTLNKRLLIATSGFGALTGGVTPDYTLPSTNFFNPAGDTLTLFLFGTIDQRSFTSVPTDGVLSRHYPSNTLAINSPTNYSGHAGSVNVAPPPASPADFNGDLVVDAQDLAAWSGDFGLNAESDADADLDSDGADFVIWQRELGQSSSAPLTVAVPEPAGATLAALAWLSVVAAVRWQRAGARHA
jgi:hypothetical protein